MGPIWPQVGMRGSLPQSELQTITGDAAATSSTSLTLATTFEVTENFGDLVVVFLAIVCTGHRSQMVNPSFLMGLFDHVRNLSSVTVVSQFSTLGI